MREMAIVSRQRATGEVGRGKRRGHADGGNRKTKQTIQPALVGQKRAPPHQNPAQHQLSSNPKGKGGKGPKGPIPTRPPKQTMMVRVQGESTTATGMVKPVREVSDSARVRTSAPSSLEPKVTRSVGPENSRATVGKAPGNNGSAPAMSVGGDGPTVLDRETGGRSGGHHNRRREGGYYGVLKCRPCYTIDQQRGGRLLDLGGTKTQKTAR
ncbi:hypothetical protein ACJJTC_004734 [Scirpophaga incertulas]